MIKNKKVLIGIILFFIFIILFITVDPWFGLGILASMLFISLTYETINKDAWNNGMCADNNKPWEYTCYVDLSDGDTYYIFNSGDYSHSFGRTFMHNVLKEYKGITKIQGL